ncbi:MAG: right-handed parallel beta-helix repeat-containing protein [Candidatus Diapherotrites archaeon]
MKSKLMYASFLIILMVLLVSVFAVKEITAKEAISPKSIVVCGDTITEDTNLTNDLIDCGGRGLIIEGNNITLDCQDHLIDGTEISNSKGIYLNTVTGTTVENCRISEFDFGIYLENSNYNTIINNNSYNNGYFGIFLWQSHGNALIDNNTSNNDSDGIYFDSSNSNLIANHNTNNNENCGIYLGNSRNNSVTNSVANENDWAGILLNYTSNNNEITNNVFQNNNEGVRTMNSMQNIFYENIFSNNTEYNAYESMGTNDWNNTTTGNYWGDFNSNPGYPTHYEIPGNGNGVDYFPDWEFGRKADLNITFLKASVSSVPSTQQIKVTYFFTIKNIGIIDSGDFYTGILIEEENLSPSHISNTTPKEAYAPNNSNHVAKEAYTSNLAPTESITIMREAILDNGSYTITATADNRMQVDELNESNNTATIHIEEN